MRARPKAKDRFDVQSSRWTRASVATVATSAIYLWWRLTATLQGANPLLATLLLVVDLWGIALLAAWLFRTRPGRAKVATEPGNLLADVVITAGVASMETLERTLLSVLAVDQRGRVVVIGRGVSPDFAALCDRYGASYRSDGGATGLDSFMLAGSDAGAPLVLWLDAGQVPRSDVIRLGAAWFENDEALATLQLGEGALNADSFAAMRRVGDDDAVDQRIVLPAAGSRGVAPWSGPGSIVRRQAVMSLRSGFEGDPAATLRLAGRLQSAGWRTGHDPRRLIGAVAPDSLVDYLGYRRRRSLAAFRFFVSAEGPLRARTAPRAWRLAGVATVVQYTASFRSVLLASIVAATLVTGQLPLAASLWGAVWFALPYALVAMVARPATSGGSLRVGEWSRAQWRNLGADLSALRAMSARRPTQFVRRGKPSGAAAIGHLRVLSGLVVLLDVALVLRATTLLWPGLLRPMSTTARVVTIAATIAMLVPMVDVMQLVVRRKQRRTSTRYACAASAEIVGQNIAVAPIDISVKGIGLESPVGLAVGEHLTLRVTAPLRSGDRDIEVDAVVRAVSPVGERFRIGLEYCGVEAYARQVLIAYCIELGGHGTTSVAAITRPGDLQGSMSDARRRRVRALTVPSIALGALVMIAGPSAASTDPVAADDYYAVSVGDTLIVSAPGVLENDLDPSGNGLSAWVTSGPSDGSFSFNGDGSFTYAPYASSATSDSFTYEVTDGNVTVSATVYLTINDAPPPPTLQAADDYYSVSVGEELSVSVPGVFENDSNPSGNGLWAWVSSGPSNGNLSFSGDGSFSYTSYASSATSDSFTYEVTDGNNTVSATVYLTINDAPPPPTLQAADDSYSVYVGDTLSVSAPGVFENDTDPWGNGLSAWVGSGPLNGSLTFNGDGSFSYTSYASSATSDSFTYEVTDGNNTVSATVYLSIDEVPPPPALAASDDYYSLSVGEELSVSAPGVFENDTDPSGNGLSAWVSSGPSNGNLSFSGDGSFSYTSYASSATSDSFTYEVTDGNNTVSATVYLSIDDPPPPPPTTLEALDDSYSLYIGEELSVSAPGVLGNDTDPSGNGLSAWVSSGPSNGNLSFSSDGSFSYTSYATSPASDSFTYVVTDGSATESATVYLAINDVPPPPSPSASDDSYSLLGGDTLVVSAPGVMENDSDPSGNGLAATLVSGPTHGSLSFNGDGSFTYESSSTTSVNDSFTYFVFDGSSSSNVATVTLNVQGRPIAVADAISMYLGRTVTVDAPGVMNNDSDGIGAGMTASLVDNVSNGDLSFNSDGSFSYTPYATTPETDSFTYVLFDGYTVSDPATVTINVVGPPSAVDDSYVVYIGETLSVPPAGVLANDSPSIGLGVSATLIENVTRGTLSLNSDGSFTYAPTGSTPGTDSFTYRIADGNEVGSIARVTINVLSGAVAVDDQYTAYVGNQLSVTAISGVLANDTDRRGNGLSATLVSGPTSGSLTLDANGSFLYTPQSTAPTTDSFTYRISDDVSSGNLATVTINVLASPTAANDVYYVYIGQTLTVTSPGVLANDSNPSGGALTSTLVSPPTSGTFSLSGSGAFTYTPSVSSATIDSFTYRATSTDAASNSATVTIHVLSGAAAVNDAYVAYIGNARTVSAFFGVLGNDSDALNSGLSATLVSGPSQGSLTFNSDGSFVYTTQSTSPTTDSFTYRVSDAYSSGNTASVALTVSNPPQAFDDSYLVVYGSSSSVPAPGVLANDTEPSGAALTAALVSAPTSGSLVLNSDGSFSYLPLSTTATADSFTYRASNGVQQTNLATVNLTIAGIPVTTTTAPPPTTATPPTTAVPPAPSTTIGSSPLPSTTLAVAPATTASSTTAGPIPPASSTTAAQASVPTSTTAAPAVPGSDPLDGEGVTAEREAETSSTNSTGPLTALLIALGAAGALFVIARPRRWR